MMAKKLPKNKRVKLIPKIVLSLVENGTADMSDEKVVNTIIGKLN